MRMIQRLSALILLILVPVVQAVGDSLPSSRGFARSYLREIASTFQETAQPTKPTNWFPTVPQTIGEWSATTKPIDRERLERLGNPPTASYTFSNPFGEQVQVQAISGVTFAAYGEPQICEPRYGFDRTALKIAAPFGSRAPIRARVFNSRFGKGRAILYDWVQRRDGSTEIPSLLKLHQEFDQTGRDTPVPAEVGCIVYAAIMVDPGDHLGQQARRDLERVCQGIFTTFRQDRARASTKDSSPHLDAGSSDSPSPTSGLVGDEKAIEDGPDIAYLSPPTAPPIPNRASDDLLPLIVGDTWRMRSTSGSKVSKDKLTVVGPVTPPGGVASIEIDTEREGAPWRQESYSTEKDTGVFLTSMKDEISPKVVFTEPVPLLRYGFKVGDTWSWQGSALIDGKGPYVVTSLSRVTFIESLTTPIGNVSACRIDNAMMILISTRTKIGYTKNRPPARFAEREQASIRSLDSITYFRSGTYVGYAGLGARFGAVPFLWILARSARTGASTLSGITGSSL